MDTVTLSTVTNPSQDEIAHLIAGLSEHARPFTQTPGFEPVAVFARGSDQTIVGGALGRINWNWLHVELLWVNSPQRAQGLGRKLLADLEQVGIEAGCRHAHVETFTFQARGFYERCGYTPFAALDDYPPGFTKIYFRKELAGDADA